MEGIVIGVMGIELHGLDNPLQTLLRSTGIVQEGGQQNVGIGIILIILDRLFCLHQRLYPLAHFSVSKTSDEVSHGNRFLQGDGFGR